MIGVGHVIETGRVNRASEIVGEAAAGRLAFEPGIGKSDDGQLSVPVNEPRMTIGAADGCGPIDGREQMAPTAIGASAIRIAPGACAVVRPPGALLA